MLEEKISVFYEKKSCCRKRNKWQFQKEPERIFFGIAVTDRIGGIYYDRKEYP